jgi:hypothetical protein
MPPRGLVKPVPEPEKDEQPGPSPLLGPVEVEERHHLIGLKQHQADREQREVSLRTVIAALDERVLLLQQELRNYEAMVEQLTAKPPVEE